ncbi:MAG: phage portal protein, partial [Corynebacterium sp.]
FEEKAAVTSTAVGAPWMTVNEARGMNNMPGIEGGDELARPMNTSFGDDVQDGVRDDEPGEEDS